MHHRGHLQCHLEEDEGDIETIWAASHVLAALGPGYVWPITNRQNPAADQAIQILTQPPENRYGFLDLWDENPEDQGSH